MALKKDHRLRKPSGDYTVGCTRFEYEYEPKTNTGLRRIPCLCFYPSNIKDVLGSPKKYISDILWPGAGDIMTNSYWNIPILPGKHPLILHSHGLGSALEENTVQFEELASNGYIVLSYGHEGSGAYLMRNGDTLTWDPNEYFNELNASKDQRDKSNQWFADYGANASVEEQMRRYQAHTDLRPQTSALVDVGRRRACGA